MRKPVPRKDRTDRTPASARGVAFDVLARAAESGKFASEILDAELGRLEISPADKRLAVELTYGVVRRVSPLDAVLTSYISRDFENVEPALKVLLRLGAYQLLFLNSIPPHAAVNETTALAARAGQTRWTGFANGVLRSLARGLNPEVGTAPAANALPLAPGQFRLLDRSAFPNPALDPAGYIASAFGFPNWLVDRWKSRFGPQELERLAFWFNATPKTCLRVNALRTNREELLQQFAQAGINSHAGTHPQSIWLDQGVRIEELPGFSEGKFAVQDESAMGAATLLAPQPAERVLDLCAAPGGKTSHLAELMRNTGSVLAVDVTLERLRRVEENCRRLGDTIVATRLVDRDLADLPTGPFDAILVDVPCSNTGVLGKRPEARWRLNQTDLAELTELQRRLLLAAIDRSAPGGRVLYSTCSIEPEENAGVVDSVLREHPELSVAARNEHVPGQPADGGFQALLTRGTK